MAELTCGECDETNSIDLDEVDVLTCPDCGEVIR